MFLPGESHGQRSLEGYSQWGHKGRCDKPFSVHTCLFYRRGNRGAGVMKVSFLKTAELVSWLHCRPRSPRGSILSTCTRVQSRSTLCDPVDYSPHRRLCPWDFPGKNTGMGCHFLLQGNFWTQGLNLSVRHWEVDSLPLSHQGSPYSRHSSCDVSLVKTVLFLFAFNMSF